MLLIFLTQLDYLCLTFHSELSLYLCDMHIPSSIVSAIIHKLDPYKACKPDGTREIALKKCASKLFSLNAKINGLLLFCFPANCKFSFVAAVIKNSDHTVSPCVEGISHDTKPKGMNHKSLHHCRNISWFNIRASFWWYFSFLIVSIFAVYRVRRDPSIFPLVSRLQKRRTRRGNRRIRCS